MLQPISEPKKPSRWIITGGSGFLGANFINSLHDDDGEVVVIDRYASRWPSLRAGLRQVEQDVREVESYADELIKDSVVVHMASSSYPGKAEKVIESDIQDNVLGTVRLAQACADRGVGTFIFLSSGGAIYGDQPATPIKEDANPKPISAYGAMKLTIEHYLSIIHNLRGLPIACLRVSNPFGKWHKGTGQGAINVFMQNVLNGKEIEIWGEGEQLRDYIPAQDVANAIRTVGLRFGSGCEAFNIGTGSGRTLKDVLSEIEKISHQAPKVSFLPARSVDVASNILDSSKMREWFGWQSATPFSTAMEETWNWVKSQV